MSEAVRKHIAHQIAAAQQQQIAFLAELVKVPSDNPPGDCRRHAERTAALLEALGFSVERHAVPEALVRASGMQSVTNLVVRHQFAPDGPTIALNAHGDAVPPGEGWQHDPYGAEIVDGTMFGRGVAVSKSDIAAYAFALHALTQPGLSLHGCIELHITYDEESGGEIGPAFLLREGVSRPDLAIAAGFSYAVVTAHNGCLHLEVQVQGRSAHAAMPETGVDALEASTSVLAALYRLRHDLRTGSSAVPGIGSPQLTVGLISGGINTNVVPDRVTFRLDRRMIPEEDPQEVEAELRGLIGQAIAPFDGASVTVRRILLAKPLTPLPGVERLASVLCEEATRVMGETVTTKGMPLYTDARHYAEAGVPIVLFGAGPHSIEQANAHRANECLQLDDLRKATEAVAAALARLLQPS